MHRWNRFGLFVLILSSIVFMLSGCSRLTPKQEPTAEPQQPEAFAPVVSATGVVVPQQWTRLSIAGSGFVSDVLVEEDERVSTGQTLIRLDGREDVQAAIAAANLEVTAAQRDLDKLKEDPEVRSAQANQVVVDAKQNLRDAERYLNNLLTEAPQADIDQARANMLIAKDRLKKAIEDFEPYEKKDEDNIVRAGLLSKKAQRQKEYDAAVRKYNNLIGANTELDIAEAEADLAVAEANLLAAQRDYEILKDEPDPAEVAVLQARLENAQAQLTAATASLEDLELKAPFEGTVSELQLKESEWVAPGQPALLLANLEKLRVETTDLNEIDVARVRVGNQAIVTFDALPDVTVNGTVLRIAPKASEGSGVNYTVVIELDEIPKALRWGMTAFVDIQVD